MTAKLLVVDNDPEMVRTLERHLAADGFTVRAVTSGQEAGATSAPPPGSSA